jgi:hypothetical protein
MNSEYSCKGESHTCLFKTINSITNCLNTVAGDKNYGQPVCNALAPFMYCAQAPDQSGILPVESVQPELAQVMSHVLGLK